MRNERGFTLAELLVGIAVVGLLMAALFFTLLEGQSAFLFGSQRAEIQQNARQSLAKVVEELRTGTTVTALAATSITFQFVDYVPGPPETCRKVTVQYSLNGTDIQRNQTAGLNCDPPSPPAPPLALPGPETLVGGVTSLTFTGFDQNNNPTNTPANVYAVQVRVTAQPERPPANQQVVFEDLVRLRNK